MATLPAVTARCALTTAPLATPTWTNLSSRLRGFTTERGRGSELDEFQPGTGAVVLGNRDRHLDPANTSSPYSGNLKARKRFSLQATWAGTTYDLLDAHVKTWPQEWEGRDGRCDLPLADAFEMFQNETFSSDGVRAEERSDQRIGFILDQYSWPAGRRELGTGRVSIQAHDYDGMNMLGHMREVERAESGFLFMDGQGDIVFQDKYYRLNNYTTSQATFGENELPYSDPEFELDVEHIVNHATGKLANQESPRIFEITDSTSITDHGRTAKTIESWAALEPEAEAQAMAYVDFYKQPIYRVNSITVMPQKSPALLFPQVLGRVIGERITVKARFYGIGPLLTHEARIEGIRHDVQPGIWKTTFRLSPVFTQETLSYWLLGTSVLGTDTVLAW